ncbi:MAG: DUF1289 domain-containing protein [Pseudomonadota bacterium]
MDSAAIARPQRPESPCISICTLDDGDVCMGCARTLDEIVRWSGMSAAEQWSVVRRVGSSGFARPGVVS